MKYKIGSIVCHYYYNRLTCLITGVTPKYYMVKYINNHKQKKLSKHESINYINHQFILVTDILSEKDINEI